MMVREELAKYLNNKPCPECDGTRLKREARNVKVGTGDDARAIYEVSALPLKEAVAVLRAAARSTGTRRRSPTRSSRRSCRGSRS